jgi:hypothetical protein
MNIIFFSLVAVSFLFAGIDGTIVGVLAVTLFSRFSPLPVGKETSEIIKK